MACLDDLWKLIGSLTGLERVLLVLVGLLFLNMIFGKYAHPIFLIVGFACPVYQHILTLETDDTVVGNNRFTYWCIFSVFALFGFFGCALTFWFPFIWLADSVYVTSVIQRLINCLHPHLRSQINRFFDRITGHLDEQTKRIFKEFDSPALAKEEDGDGGDTVVQCRICLDPITDVLFGHLEECDHLYCETCLRRWMEENPGRPISCPTCRVVSHTIIFDERPLSEVEKRIKMGLVVCFPREMDGDEDGFSFSEDEDDESSEEEEEELPGAYEEASLD